MTTISRQLIERFFKKECTAEEAEIVVRYLGEHPELLEEYASRKEWDEVDALSSLSPVQREEMRQQVLAATEPQPRRISESSSISQPLHHRIGAPSPHIRAKHWIAAACTAGLLILGYTYLFNKQAPASPTTTRVASVPQSTLKTISNPGANKMNLTTPDGSTIELGAFSRLSYQEPFAPDARNFRLTGTARFDVAKDARRTFTVLAGGIATTALGTSFIVHAIDSEAQVSVQLLSGKVAVRRESASTANTAAAAQPAAQPATANGATAPPAAAVQPIILLPGEEMLFDKNKNSMAKRSIHRTDDPARKDDLTIHPKNTPSNPIGTTSETPEAWTFHNQPLPEIFQVLKEAYAVNILYTDRQLSKIRFTGTFNKSDSLSYILGTLGSMSNVHIEKEGDSYKVKK